MAKPRVALPEFRATAVMPGDSSFRELTCVRTSARARARERGGGLTCHLSLSARLALPRSSPLLPPSHAALCSNKDFMGSWTVLFFYPLDFTFVCPTEIIAFSDRIADFAKVRVPKRRPPVPPLQAAELSRAAVARGGPLRPRRSARARAPRAVATSAAALPAPTYLSWLCSWAPRWRPSPLTPSFRTLRG